MAETTNTNENGNCANRVLATVIFAVLTMGTVNHKELLRYSKMENLNGTLKNYGKQNYIYGG